MMTIGEVPGNRPLQTASDLTAQDLRVALAAGWQDFRAYPMYGLFFGAFYVLIGLALAYGLLVRGEANWLIPAASGFPLLAPFAAVGLYEVSRRREAGLPLRWGAVLGAMKGRGDEQLPLMGGMLFVAFSFWMIIAHTIFGIFFAQSYMGSQSWAFLLTGEGIAMLAIGGAAGAVLAWLFYCVTVISLPVLVDRDVDFITAIIASLRTVSHNRAVMLGWAMVVAIALFLAMLPLFAGLLVVLPVLGHATWHLYRRVTREG